MGPFRSRALNAFELLGLVVAFTTYLSGLFVAEPTASDAARWFFSAVVVLSNCMFIIMGLALLSIANAQSCSSYTGTQDGVVSADDLSLQQKQWLRRAAMAATVARVGAVGPTQPQGGNAQAPNGSSTSAGGDKSGRRRQAISLRASVPSASSHDANARGADKAGAGRTLPGFAGSIQSEWGKAAASKSKDGREATTKPSFGAALHPVGDGSAVGVAV